MSRISSDTWTPFREEGVTTPLFCPETGHERLARTAAQFGEDRFSAPMKGGGSEAD